MRTFAFIEFEDVLARKDKTPIQLGLMLVRCLKSGFRLALSTRDRDQQILKHWLGVNGFSDDYFTLLLPRQVTEAHLEDDALFAAHLSDVRVNATVELAVTVSPTRAASAMRQNVPILLMGNPTTTPTEFLPSRRREWAEIEAEVELARVQKAEASKE